MVLVCFHFLSAIQRLRERVFVVHQEILVYVGGSLQGYGAHNFTGKEK